MSMPKVVIVLLNWNNYLDSRECLLSVRKLTYPNFEVIVVDNGSEDGSGEELQRAFPWASFIRSDTNRGFSGGNNLGIMHALSRGADYLLLLNNDTVIREDALTEAVDAAENDHSIGIVGGKIYLYGSSNLLLHVGGKLRKGPLIWMRPRARCVHFGHHENDYGQYDRSREVTLFLGTALLVRRRVIDVVGLLPDDYFFAMEDFDFTNRVYQAGFKLLYLPKFVVWHKVSRSHKGQSLWAIYNQYRNKLLFQNRSLSPIQWRFWFFIYKNYFQYFARWFLRFQVSNPALTTISLKAARLAISDHMNTARVTLDDIRKAERVLKSGEL